MIFFHHVFLDGLWVVELISRCISDNFGLIGATSYIISVVYCTIEDTTPGSTSNLISNKACARQDQSQVTLYELECEI